jgi:uncharacterized protein involved in exopolysaccharide biosynthesis
VRAPPTILGAVASGAWFRDATRRRLAFLAAAIVSAILCVLPRHYVAKAELAPQDAGVGLNSILGAGAAGGLVSLGALVGNQQTIETDLTVSRSNAVLRSVVAKLNLVGRNGYGDADHAEVKLKHKVNIEALRGSALEIQAKDKSPAFARDIVAAYTAAIKERLAAISLQQTALKRSVTNNRLSAASVQLAQAQKALTDFRIQHHLAAPEIQLGAAVANLANLQAQLHARAAELEVAQQFATGQNVQVAAIRAEITSLQGQIAQAQVPVTAGAGGPTLGGMGLEMTQYSNLYREERGWEILYEIYQRYLESVTVDELSAYANLNIIEPAYVDPARQYNIPGVGLLVLVVVAAFGSEFYLVYPPIGRRRPEGAYGA